MTKRFPVWYWEFYWILNDFFVVTYLARCKLNDYIKIFLITDLLVPRASSIFLWVFRCFGELVASSRPSVSWGATRKTAGEKRREGFGATGEDRDNTYTLQHQVSNTVRDLQVWINIIQQVFSLLREIQTEPALWRRRWGNGLKLIQNMPQGCQTHKTKQTLSLELLFSNHCSTR